VTVPTGEATESSLSGHVIVCGLQDVGLRIVEQLHAAGETVIVVDDDPNPRLVRIIADLGITHLAASAQRTSTLRRAGIDAALAIVCVVPDELRNLEVALLARRMRPELRVVVQLTNQAVGRAVARVTGAGTVLDVATLAAPAFVEACLERRSHALELAGEQFRILEKTVDTSGSLRAIFGDLAPVAVVPGDGSAIHVCPGRDLEVGPGDRVVVVGTVADLDERRLTAPPPQAHHLHAERHHRLATLWRYVNGFLRETERSMRLTVLALFLIACVSVLILSFSYRTADHQRLGPLNATYFTIETLTTVGYGDFSFGSESAFLRIWAIILMILGATLVTVVYALLTNLLVSRRIEHSLGRQQASRMSGHVILIGLGSVGLRVLELLLAAGEQVVVLDRDENNRYISAARSLNVPIVIGDATTPGTLAAINLGSARAVAVLTSSDLANIETGLAVDELLGDRWAGVPVVMRVFDRQLARTIEEGFGFRHVRSTSELAAPWFVGAALGLDIISTFYVDNEPLLIGRLTIATSGGLQGQTMLDLSAKMRVIAISRARENGRLEYPPRRDTRFEGGDQAYLIGPYEELLRVLHRDQLVSD
jgi:Trk K+ transport system NAD-binding subunit